jgi:hypothetical protein
MKGKISNPNFMKKPAASTTQAAHVSTGNKMLDAALTRAKNTGALIVSDKQLKKFPDEILKFEDLQVLENWWEGMPLTKIDLTNNEIPAIPEEIAS